MKTVWNKGLNDQQAKIVNGEFKGSPNLRAKLNDIILDKIKEAETLSTRRVGYESPNWAYFQADVIGYKRALSEIISLIQNDNV
jgi:hypothetical protein